MTLSVAISMDESVTKAVAILHAAPAPMAPAPVRIGHPAEMQVLTGVGLGVWVHYFSFLPTGEPCREKGTPSG